MPEWFPKLQSVELERLHKFHGELVKFTGTVNLISINTIGVADQVHFGDSISATQLIFEKCQAPEIFDIGSGNGLPALVMAILDSHRRIVCVERDARKSEFLKHVASVLALKNFEVKIAGVETLGEGSVKCGVSRGFASVSKAILATRKQFAVGGEYFHIKGDTWGRELAEIPSQLCTFWEPSLLAGYRLPAKDEKRAVVLTKKIAA